MKKQIKNLSLHELDFLVAKAEGLNAFILKKVVWVREKGKYDIVFEPTTNPSQAWPIIERERIGVIYIDYYTKWMAESEKYSGFGETSLEAAMRCYLCYTDGEEVEI
jgi:hypothetical protein